MSTPSISSTRHMPNPSCPAYTLCGRKRDTAALILPVTAQRERVGCKDCLAIDARSE